MKRFRQPSRVGFRFLPRRAGHVGNFRPRNICWIELGSGDGCFFSPAFSPLLLFFLPVGAEPKESSIDQFRSGGQGVIPKRFGLREVSI